MRVENSTPRASRRRRSSSQRAASMASLLDAHRATTSRPPFAKRRSPALTIGAASNTCRSSCHAIVGFDAPFFVLQTRCASRSTGSLPFLPWTGFTSASHRSRLGPRSSLTDRFGSTGRSQIQHRQLAASPTSSMVATPGGYALWPTRPRWSRTVTTGSIERVRPHRSRHPSTDPVGRSPRLGD